MEIEISKVINVISRVRALAHPINFGIITLLEANKQLSVTEIYKKLKITQPVASHYLLDLKRRGILLSKRNGQKVFYSINTELFDKVKEGIETITSIEVSKRR